MYITMSYNLYSTCRCNMSKFKLKPLLCTHVYLYVFGVVHPPPGVNLYELLIYFQFRTLKGCSYKEFQNEECHGSAQLVDFFSSLGQ